MSMEESSRVMMKMTATNYILWRSRMKDFLSYKDMFDPIESKVNNLDLIKEPKWKKLSMKTIG